MPAQTSGGLVKTSFTVTEEQLASIKQVAQERGLSDSGATRELLELGYRVYQRRKVTTGLVEDLAVAAVAGEAA